MKTLRDLPALAAGLAFTAAACAGTPVPSSLTLARASYASLRDGPVALVAPAYLEAGRAALDDANREFWTNGDTGLCRDLAYIAENKLELAASAARIEMHQSAGASSAAADP